MVETGAAADVWIHGLYVHAVPQRTSDITSLIFWQPSRAQATSGDSRLWLTDMTLQGTSQTLAASSPVYAEGLPPPPPPPTSLYLSLLQREPAAFITSATYVIMHWQLELVK